MDVRAITGRTIGRSLAGTTRRGGGGGAFELLDKDIEERFVKASPCVCVCRCSMFESVFHFDSPP